ncbi:MAG: DUF2203 domain-containing protein [Myxococcales bacterium]|nr:DUF2203 domain-containing protein [Myxococcales bacterium]MCB9582056.1 DUF2203 domain-containing protein [Polyangiaceae bacterium]
MSSRRVFTIAEVDALIPELTAIVERQLRRQSEIEECLAELARSCGGLPHALEDEAEDTSAVLRMKADLRQRIAHYEQGWEDVAALGAVLKDPQIGLVDFYGEIEGRRVWLCWRHGEERLRYYHELSAGFSGRVPLRPETRHRLLN